MVVTTTVSLHHYTEEGVLLAETCWWTYYK